MQLVKLYNPMTSAVTWFVVAFNSDCQCFGNGTESLHHIRREMVDIMLLNSTAKPSVCGPCSTLGFVAYSLQLCPTCWSNAVLFFCMCLRLLACQIVSILWFLPTGFLLTQCLLAYCTILRMGTKNLWGSSFCTRQTDGVPVFILLYLPIKTSTVPL